MGTVCVGTCWVGGQRFNQVAVRLQTACTGGVQNGRQSCWKVGVYAGTTTAPIAGKGVTMQQALLQIIYGHFFFVLT